MDAQKRQLLAITLSMTLVMVWMMFTTPAAVPGSADAGVVEAPLAVSADAGTLAVLQPGDAPLVPVELPKREVTRERNNTALTFSSEGASLSSALLKGVKEREQVKMTIVEGYQQLFGKPPKTGPQMNLAVPALNKPPPFSVSITGEQSLPPTTRYEVLDEGATFDTVRFRAQKGPWLLEKTFHWDSKAGYAMGIDVTVTNTSAAEASGELGMHLWRKIDPAKEEAASLFGGIGNQAMALCSVADKVHRRRPDEKPPESFNGTVHYAALDQQYFIAAAYPIEKPQDGRCTVTVEHEARGSELFFPIKLAAGQKQTYRFGGFAGPKDFELLQTMNAAGTAHPALESSVDYGWWAAICKLLLWVMKFFHRLTGNWGLSIIFLTLVAKIVLLPLTHKAMVSAEAMKKLAPRMEEIKKKFPNDRERQGMETMKLYQETGANPIQGCLPLLLQFPIWGALFYALRTSYDLYGEPFFGPIWRDLTYPDPTYLLPLALGVTMIITQKLQPQMTVDPVQARLMTWVMPIVFTAMMMNYPAGLALYIFTNNLLSIGQQYALRKYLEKKGVAQPASQLGKLRKST
ncbi:MAG: membrane protein insertase YidC [Myxococcaceae bacterium]|nr:membrane protein insertase YidC [Myxococcaceae bacterium]